MSQLVTCYTTWLAGIIAYCLSTIMHILANLYALFGREWTINTSGFSTNLNQAREYPDQGTAYPDQGQQFFKFRSRSGEKSRSVEDVPRSRYLDRGMVYQCVHMANNYFDSFIDIVHRNYSRMISRLDHWLNCQLKVLIVIANYQLVEYMTRNARFFTFSEMSIHFSPELSVKSPSLGFSLFLKWASTFPLSCQWNPHHSKWRHWCYKDSPDRHGDSYASLPIIIAVISEKYTPRQK